jgi:hypothetical protein
LHDSCCFRTTIIGLLHKSIRLLLLLIAQIPGVLYAQDHWAADSTRDTTGAAGELRPRRDTYLIETYPSPARLGQNVIIQFYNHNPTELAVEVLDLLNKVVFVVQPRTLMANGLHRVEMPATRLASGAYFIRLRTYTGSGKLAEEEVTRFVIVR